jgi:hypothetical protein
MFHGGNKKNEFQVSSFEKLDPKQSGDQEAAILKLENLKPQNCVLALS